MHWKFPEIPVNGPGDQAVNDLGHQLERYVQRWTQGSIRSRYRYAAACARFVKIAGRGTHGQPGMQKLANMSDKHLIKYAQHLLSQGNASKYAKNELTALRYLHSTIPNTRHELGNSQKINKEAGLRSTPNFKKGAEYINKASTRDEVDRFVKFATENGREKTGIMGKITTELGTRLEEIATLRTTHIENARRTGLLHLTNTKGGRPRDIPVNDKILTQLEHAARDVPRGGYVFVPPDMPVHTFIQSTKDFIHNNRDKFQDPTRVGDKNRTELHWHSFRHQYAQVQYADLRAQGMSDREARLEVAQLLGHNRIDVTYVYVPR